VIQSCKRWQRWRREAAKLEQLETLEVLLLPRDPNDDKNIMLEIRQVLAAMRRVFGQRFGSDVLAMPNPKTGR